MQLEGVYNIKAPKNKIFDFIVNPKQLSKCLPDLQNIEVQSDSSFKAKVKVGVGFVKGSFDFQMSIAEKTSPTHARLKGHGTGSGSTIDLDTRIDLEDDGSGGSNLKWKADAAIGGLLAGVGQRLMGSASDKQVKALFECIKKNLEK